MIIETTIEDGIATLTPDGLIGGTECTKLHDFIKEMIDKEVTTIILNMEKVTWINSSGLGIIIGAHAALHKNNGRLIITNIKENIMVTLLITKLDRIFVICETMEEALKLAKEE